MLREYLEECLQDTSDKLEDVKKEYYKNKNVADILDDKIEKSKSDMDTSFSAFFPRSEQKDEKLYMSRFCEERNTIKDKLYSLEQKKTELETQKKRFEQMLKELGELEKKAMFHVKH